MSPRPSSEPHTPAIARVMPRNTRLPMAGRMPSLGLAKMPAMIEKIRRRFTWLTVAYHLHSYSAYTLRSTNQYWCGPLLAAGATATMGCIDEPFLAGTPNMEVFFSRWLLLGFTFGEAACAAQGAVSWQTTVVGDPLFRPFGGNPQNDGFQRTRRAGRGRAPRSGVIYQKMRMAPQEAR